MIISLLIILIWPTAAQLRTFTGHSAYINEIATDGDFLFSSSDDSTIKQWSIMNGSLIRTFTGNVFSIAVSGDFLFGGSWWENIIGQWSISSGSLIHNFVGHSDGVRSVAVQGDFLFSGSADKTIRQWSISTVSLIRTFIGHSDAVLSVAVSGDFLFSGSSDYTINQWSISSGGLIRTLTGHTGLVFSIAIGGNFLFSGSRDQTIKQWSISSGELIRTFIGHTNWVYSVAVSGDYLYSGSWDENIKQWSISTGEFIRDFIGHTAWVFSVAVSGNFLFSGSEDRTIKQWCASDTYQSGSQCFQCPTNAQCSMNDFTCNSGYVASGSSCFFTRATRTTRTSQTTRTTPTTQTARTTSFMSGSPATETLETSTDFISTTLIPTPQQPDNNLSNMITYIAVGGTALAAIVSVGFFAASLYHRKNQRERGKTSQQQIISTEGLAIRRRIDPSTTSTSPSVFGGQNYLNELTIRKIFPSYNSNVVNDSVNSYSLPDISSVANNNTQQSLSTNQLYNTTNTWTKTAPSSFNTTTIFTNTQRGLYVPGNFLLTSASTLIRPLSRVLHSNRNCKVECFQVLDGELRKRCRTDVVAVKTLHGINQNTIDSFYQEISIMYYFRGKPNFAQLVGFCDSPYQVLTDYYSLGSLAQALLWDSRSIQPCKLVAILFSLQISGALEQMHNNGFSHSDIKALNVFVDRDNNNGGALQCYLGDFGLTQILDDTHLVVKSYRIFNRKGLTAAYAAPEMLKRFRGGINDASKVEWKAGDFLRSDIYSLGILLYEIVCCIRAWE